VPNRRGVGIGKGLDNSPKANNQGGGLELAGGLENIFQKYFISKGGGKIIGKIYFFSWCNV